MGTWTPEQIRDSTTNHSMLTWAPGKARHSTPIITHGEGVYLYDHNGNKFLDWTSQAVCSNLGYTIPPEIVNAVSKQMTELAYVYGGLGLSEVRARLSKLVAELLPGDLNGMVFPSSGSEANEAAIMAARRYTGKFKVINWYRSYHGGTTNSQQATGDFRRWFGKDTVPGFVKVNRFSWICTLRDIPTSHFFAILRKGLPSVSPVLGLCSHDGRRTHSNGTEYAGGANPERRPG
jgi:4-aminobutyrate aminotransferase-like enzyme